MIYFLFYPLIIFNIIVAQQSTPTLPIDKPLHVYVINNNTQQTDTQLQTLNLQKTSCDLADQMRDQAKTYYKNNGPALLSFIYNNPLRIISGTLLFSWLSIGFYCLYAELYLCKYLQWAIWKDQLDNQTLYAMPLTQLQKELLADIQKYYQLNNLSDFFAPLVSFFNDTQNELIFLQRFIALHNLIQKTHLTKIFPSQEQALKTAHIYKERITYFRNLVSSWVTQYKIENHITHD